MMPSTYFTNNARINLIGAQLVVNLLISNFNVISINPRTH